MFFWIATTIVDYILYYMNSSYDRVYRLLIQFEIISYDPALNT